MHCSNWSTNHGHRTKNANAQDRNYIGIAANNNNSANTNTAAVNGTTSALSQQFITYNDPNGKFSISYPSGWEVTRKPLTSITGFAFAAPSHNELVAPGEIGLPPALKEAVAGYPNLMDSTVLSKTLSSFQLPNMTSVKPVDCSTFTIAGHTACVTAGKMIKVRGSLGLNTQTSSVLSYMNGTMYIFQAIGLPQDYNHTYSIFAQML